MFDKYGKRLTIGDNVLVDAPSNTWTVLPTWKGGDVRRPYVGKIDDIGPFCRFTPSETESPCSACGSKVFANVRLGEDGFVCASGCVLTKIDGTFADEQETALYAVRSQG